MRASAIRQMTAASQARRLAAGLFKETVSIWDLSSKAQLAEFKTVLDFGGERLALSADGNLCAAASWRSGASGGVACYHAASGETIWHRKDIRRTQIIRFSATSKTISCGLDEGQLLRLDARTGETVESIARVRDTIERSDAGVALFDYLERGYVLKGPSEIEIPRTTGTMLDAAFSADLLCLSESAGPVRCFEIANGTERWSYETAPDSHVLQLHFARFDGNFYGVAWGGGGTNPRVLLRFASKTGKSTEVRRFYAWEQAFSPCDETLVTSAGEVIDLINGITLHHLPFPQTDYHGSI